MIFERLDKVLAQWMAWAVFRHQDAAQVAMTLKAHPEQVKNLPFHPVRRFPHSLERMYHRIFPRQLDLEHRSVAELVGEKVIDDLDAILVIDTTLIGQTIHRRLGVVAQRDRDFDNRRRINHAEWVGLA